VRAKNQMGENSQDEKMIYYTVHNFQGIEKQPEKRRKDISKTLPFPQ